MLEKRRHKRITVEGIYGSIFLSHTVEILNLGFGGVAIQVNRSLPVSKGYVIKLGDKEQIELKGTALWSELKKPETNPHISDPIYHVGIRFEDIFTGKKNVLVNFIEANKETSNEATSKKERWGGVRATVPKAKTATLLEPFECKVKTINHYGMRIETIEATNPENMVSFEIFLKNISPFRVHLQDSKKDKFPIEILFDQDNTITLSGRIVRCTGIKGSSQKCYEMGVEFSELKVDSWKKLDAFIRYCENSDNV